MGSNNPPADFTPPQSPQISGEWFLPTPYTITKSKTYNIIKFKILYIA